LLSYQVHIICNTWLFCLFQSTISECLLTMYVCIVCIAFWGRWSYICRHQMSTVFSDAYYVPLCALHFGAVRSWICRHRMSVVTDVYMHHVHCILQMSVFTHVCIFEPLEVDLQAPNVCFYQCIYALRALHSSDVGAGFSGCEHLFSPTCIVCIAFWGCWSSIC
jgi:hypothetical protein